MNQVSTTKASNLWVSEDLDALVFLSPKSADKEELEATAIPSDELCINRIVDTQDIYGPRNRNR